MTRICCMPGACDYIHFSEHLHGCVQGWGFHDERTTARLCAINAISMLTEWFAALLQCLRHAIASKLDPNSLVATRSVRPIVGIVLSFGAACVGGFYSPTAAVLIFRVTLGYDAWTSQGLHGNQEAPLVDGT